jgi:outer membrane protein TolC
VNVTLPLSVLALLSAPPAPTAPTTPEGPAEPGADTLEQPLPSSGLTDDYEPPFPSDDIQLSDVLESAAATNLDLSVSGVDIEIAEATVLAAVGAYDVFITAGINGSVSETPQRGSQFAISTASSSVGGNVGFSRRLETGGQISLDIGVTRTLTDQLVNPFDAGRGSTTLSQYTIRPTLTLTHSLLQGAGVKVNRAEINKAKIATTSAEATQQLAAQNLARDIISAYWDLLFAHRDLINKRRSVEQAERQLERTRALVAAGRLSPVDAKAVEQAVAAREADVLTAENTLLDRSLTVRTLMGQEFSDRQTLGVLPTTDPVVKARTVVVQDEIDRALQANPQIRQIELALASRRIDELVAANQRLPQLEFQGSFTPQGRSIDSFPDASTGDPGAQGSWSEAFRNIFSDDVTSQGLLADWTLSGSLTLTWDVQNRGPKGQHQAAKLQIERAQVQLKQARQTVAAGVIRAANSLRTAGKTIEVTKLSSDLAQENLAAEQARFDVGRATNYDVLLRLDEVDTAAANALNAEISYLKALAELQALTGEILPAYGLDR